MNATDATQRFERACEWFIELREKPGSPEVVASWLAWCGADARNREAFEEARRVWAVTENADEESLGLTKAAPNAAANAGASATLNTPLTAAQSAAHRRYNVRFFGAAAALAAVFVAVAIIVPLGRIAPRAEPASILQTPVGVNRQVTLSDGSTVALGGGSEVVATLDAAGRRFDLSSGEAYFKVARDARRPFVVSAGPVRVTALGTEFNVRTGGDRVVVAVAQGLVQVDSTARHSVDSPLRAPLRVGAGETVSLDVLDASMQLAHADPANIASWQKGRLEFTRESLGAVIDSVNRYSGRRITLSDQSLAELHFTGTVFTGRLEDWIHGLPEIFPVTVREEASGISIVPDPR
jgi:transmembrane sensor